MIGARVVVCGIPYTVVEYEDNFDADAKHFGQSRFHEGRNPHQ